MLQRDEFEQNQITDRGKIPAIMNSEYLPSPVEYGAPQPSWFSKNWKWLVPLLIAGVLACVVFVGSLAWFIFGLIKSSEPYKHSVDLVMHDPQAVSALGAPIQTGWLINGSIRLSGSSGFADLAISVHGQAHKGTVYVLARKFAGQWNYQRILLNVDSGEQIDLLRHRSLPETEN